MWNKWPDKPAPEGEIVLVLTPSGDARELVYKTNLWWLPDMSMYVYFSPTHWKRMGT